MLLSVVALALGAVFFVRWLWLRRDLYRLAWKMPGRLGYPFIGSAHRMLVLESMDFVDECSQKYAHLETPICVWLGTQLFVYVDTVDAVEDVLQSTDCLTRQDGYRYIREGLGVDGVFTLNGAKWKHHRRLVSSSFNYNVVLSYCTVFNENCHHLVEGLRAKLGCGTFDVRDVIVPTMLNLFLEATFGANITPEDKGRFKRYISEGQGLISKRMFLPWYQIDWVWNLTRHSKRLIKCTNFGRRLIAGLIAEKLKNGSENVTFMERLIRIADENPEFDMEDVRAEALNTLTAAADTSGWSVAFTLLMLAMNPELQERVVRELRSVFPSRDTPVQRAELERLELLERCMLESLRLFPVVMMVARECTHPFQVQGYDIKPGMSIAIGVRQIHRNKAYWGERALVFDPDNFLPERVRQRNKFAYIPFLAGPRNCIGEKYAMTVMKVMLTYVLRNFKLTTDLKMEDLRLRMDINICLVGGHQIQVHPRNFEAGDVGGP